MTVAAHLDALRAAAPGCQVAAFGDLRSALVLRVSAGRSLPRERLDELCAQAAACLTGPGAASVQAGFLPAGAAALREAILLCPGETRLYLRSEQDPDDVLCCVFDTPAAARAGIDAARATLDRIGAAG